MFVPRATRIARRTCAPSASADAAAGDIAHPFLLRICHLQSASLHRQVTAFALMEGISSAIRPLDRPTDETRRLETAVPSPKSPLLILSPLGHRSPLQYANAIDFLPHFRVLCSLLLFSLFLSPVLTHQIPLVRVRLTAATCAAALRLFSIPLHSVTQVRHEHILCESDPSSLY